MYCMVGYSTVLYSTEYGVVLYCSVKTKNTNPKTSFEKPPKVINSKYFIKPNADKDDFEEGHGN